MTNHPPTWAGWYEQFGEGYRHRPSVDTGADWSTGHFSVHTDDIGLRCDAARRMGSKPGDTIDVLFMGDSYGFGNGSISKTPYRERSHGLLWNIAWLFETLAWGAIILPISWRW